MSSGFILVERCLGRIYMTWWQLMAKLLKVCLFWRNYLASHFLKLCKPSLNVTAHASLDKRALSTHNTCEVNAWPTPSNLTRGLSMMQRRGKNLVRSGCLISGFEYTQRNAIKNSRRVTFLIELNVRVAASDESPATECTALFGLQAAVKWGGNMSVRNFSGMVWRPTAWE